MIVASNFFELAVAVAISLFSLQSGAALATTVGVLTEQSSFPNIPAINVNIFSFQPPLRIDFFDRNGASS